MALKFNLPIGGYTSVIDLTPEKNPADNSVIAVNSVVISSSGSNWDLRLPEPAGSDDYSGSIIVIKNTSSSDAITIGQEGTNEPKINGGNTAISLAGGETVIFYYIDTDEGFHSFYKGPNNG